MNWWPQEAITRVDVDACISGGMAAVLFTHDINLDVTIEGACSLNDLPLAVRNGVYGNRLALQRIVRMTQPSLQVHGYWHLLKDQRIRQGDGARDVCVVSLNCLSGAAYHANSHCAVMDLAVLADDVASSVTSSTEHSTLRSPLDAGSCLSDDAVQPRASTRHKNRIVFHEKMMGLVSECPARHFPASLISRVLLPDSGHPVAIAI